jgi:hypothetical protein
MAKLNQDGQLNKIDLKEPFLVSIAYSKSGD